MRDSGINMVDDTDDMTGSANPNRAEGINEGWASGIDAAVGALSLDGGGAGGAGERHPEKRLKAVSEMILPSC